DICMADEGRSFIYLPSLNYAAGNLDAVGQMLAHPHTVPGLSDGGAHARYDLPAGGKRLLQSAEGYLHTFVAGTEVYAGGRHTGELVGRLVRGPQAAPAA
ncbi:MAG TPA: hypothetical protein VFW24_17645, partial [Acidimicrobiales bacterium]|nr:hypothetical protein [Acidimicrobiales bacterium]